MKILVTGGAGFIGSHFIRYMLDKYEYQIICLDKLTYSGNKDNLQDIFNNDCFSFLEGDICDVNLLRSIDVDAVVNFAAETHVDRSLQVGAGEFIDTNVKGVVTLCEYVKEKNIKKFVHISTDEVYGTIREGYAKEEDVLNPSNLYSATKAGGDHAALSFYKTFSLPICITRCTNNYGSFQYPEKVIPLFITNALENKALPLYGDGSQIRHWIHVLDHCSAVDLVLHKGTSGNVYNIASDFEITNKELAQHILHLLKKDTSLIKSVTDRPGHDFRYAIDCEKIKQLGWTPKVDFHYGLLETVNWYLNSPDWWNAIKQKQEEYKRFYASHYVNTNS